MDSGRWQALDKVLALVSVLLCGVAAWQVSQLPWAPSHRIILPFAFLALVILLGIRYGRAVGISGSIISALIFAVALYKPVGSVSIEDTAARQALAWSVLVGVSVSFLLLPTAEEIHRHHDHQR